MCSTCPISGSCRGQVFQKLHAISVTLQNRKIGSASPSSRAPRSPMVESLDDVLADLEAQSPAPSLPSGNEMPAQVESVCYVCRGIIPENSVMIFVPGVGPRHKTCL